MLSVGSDSSVAMWQAPQKDCTSMYANQDFQEQINDPSEFLVGRFRKVGKLGHFLTPTSACWLPNNANFAVSYRENLVSLFDTATGKEICEIAFLSIEDKKIGGRHSK